MDFKEYSEFTDPLEEDYDLRQFEPDPDADAFSPTTPDYTQEMLDLVGVLEDVTDEDLQATYGISVEEYLYPTAEAVAKVKASMSATQGGLGLR